LRNLLPHEAREVQALSEQQLQRRSVVRGSDGGSVVLRPDGGSGLRRSGTDLLCSGSSGLLRCGSELCRSGHGRPVRGSRRGSAGRSEAAR